MSATDEHASFQAAPAAARTEAPRPRAVWGLVAALALLVPFSAPAAWSLIADPTGASLQIPRNYLDLLPVADFLLVGLFLLAFYTCAPPIIVAGLLTRGEWGPTRWVGARTGFHWAWVASVGLGAVLVLWILSEMVFFATAPSDVMAVLWVICLTVAALIFVLSFPTRVRAHFRVERAPARRAAPTPS